MIRKALALPSQLKLVSPCYTTEHLWFLHALHLEGDEVLECIDLFSCSLDGGEYIPGWSIFGPAALHREWRWKIVAREVAGLCYDDVSTTGECFLGLLCERDCEKHQHSVAIPGVKWGPLAACRLKKERKCPAVFSHVWTNLCLCPSQSSLKIIFFLFHGGRGEGLSRPIEFWVQKMYFRFESKQLINCIFQYRMCLL